MYEVHVLDGIARDVFTGYTKEMVTAMQWAAEKMGWTVFVYPQFNV
jgi:hypothetical protein